jgi:aldose 1-epimerase
MLTLAGGGWEAELLPASGGAIATLRHDGQDVLRPAPPGASDPLAMASFPLVPYANRIAHGRFDFAGRSIELPRNFGDHPHTLHGAGWQSLWTVIDATVSTATLRLDHEGDAAWPWCFIAEQRFELMANSFEQALTLRNEADTAMPAGLGFHPYFPTGRETRLQARVAGAWLADATQLPTERVAADHFGDWAAGDSVTRQDLVDHCHDGWDGVATITDGPRTIRLTANGTAWLHLYMPSGEPFFCVEPVSHLPDAINRPGNGMTSLAPGEAMTITMRLEIL